MGKYRKQVWINAPPEDVSAAIDTTDTWRVIVPSMQDAEITETDEGGYRIGFVYKIAGIKSKRSIETAEAELDTQRAFDLSGMITGTYTFDMTKQGTGTRVKFDTEYTFSNRVLDRLTRQFANQYITRQFDSLLNNLKHYVEMEDADVEPETIEGRERL